MSEITLVGIIAGIIAGLSILTATVLSYRQKRQTGRWPSEVVGYKPGVSWFTYMLILWLFGRAQIPESC
jgi:hypothetical protein